jgi:phosphoglycolate phosphatase
MVELSPGPARPVLLVFDWDGTLMDSIAAIVACTQRAVAEAGVAGPDEAMVRRAIGMGLRDSMELFFPGADDQLCDRLIGAYRRHWLESFKDQPRLFPGVEATLGELAQAGYRLAVATSKGRTGLQRELDATGIGRLLAATRTVDECPPKPHPGMLLDLMRELDAAPATTLMIGDTVFDLEMARNAGVAAVAVDSGSHARAELLAAGPSCCLGGVGELPAWLAGQR